MAATRLGWVLLVAGIGLHVGLLGALGAAPGSSAVIQGTVLAGQVLATAAVFWWRNSLPPRLWAVLAVAITPLIGTIPFFYPEATIIAVPVLFLLVVFATRVLTATIARVVTAESVAVSIWVAVTSSGSPGLTAVQVLFVGGVLVLVHETLARAGIAHALLVRQLHQAAAVDGLTGLVARRAFEDTVDTALRGGITPVSLLLIDVDRFKNVNDEYGHPAGDSALRHVADLVSAGVRGSGVTVGRLGGDELGVLMEGCPEDVALRRAHDLVNQVRAVPVRTEDDVLVSLTISVGLATTVGGDRPALYAAADAALYSAKRAGRDRASSSQAHDRRATTA